MMDTPVRVVLASDDGYAMALSVTGRSIIANLDPDRDLELYVLDMGIGEENRAKVLRSLDAPRVRVRLIEVDGATVAGLPTMEWFTTATYARLLIPDLLPAHVERAIYIDCDTVVRRSVADLFDLEMDGCLSLATHDQGAPFVSCPWGLAYWFESGRAASDVNFNAGVMLMDLEGWRREEVGRRALEYVRSDRYWRNVDQEAINATAGTRFGLFDPRWNHQGEILQEHCAVILPYERDVVEQVLSDPWIIHYTLGVKPWAHGAEHPWTAEWFKYVDQTTFAGWRPDGPTKMQQVARGTKSLAGRTARRFGWL